MREVRCLRVPEKLCLEACGLRAIAAEAARRIPAVIDPDADPEEYKAWGHVIMQGHGSTNAGREIREHCVQP